jgi:hypothetical protein
VSALRRLEAPRRCERGTAEHLGQVLLEDTRATSSWRDETPSFSNRLFTWSWTVCGETTSASAISVVPRPRASSVATWRSRALAPCTSRRRSADWRLTERSMTMATRRDAAPSGSEACNVIQPPSAGTVTTSPSGVPRRANAASPRTADGMCSGDPTRARMASSSSRAGGVTSSTSSPGPSTRRPGGSTPSPRRAASKRSDARMPFAIAPVTRASTAASRVVNGPLEVRRAMCTAPQERPRATNDARSSCGMPAGASTSR